MHTQVGFDLKYVKHYSTPELAQKQVEKTLRGYILAGLVFNIVIVEQRRGGMGADAEDRRYIPLITCMRIGEKFALPYSVQQCAININRMGFVAFTLAQRRVL